MAKVQRIDIPRHKPVFRYYDATNKDKPLRVWVTPTQDEFRAGLKSDWGHGNMTEEQAQEAKTLPVTSETYGGESYDQLESIINHLSLNGFKLEKE